MELFPAAAVSRTKQLLVNGVFFVVYPVVLCARWYATNRQWSLWTEDEGGNSEGHVQYSRDEEELLRNGMLGGRMIVQKEIVLAVGGTTEEKPSMYKTHNKVENCTVSVDDESSNERNYASKPCEPLNLSKDGEGEDLNSEKLFLLEPMEKRVENMDSFSSNSEVDDDYSIRQIISSSKTYR
uniref:Uncharacterized protein n=1 Tax=Anopheles christyi TaxID=43041 RepID=A0A182KEW6_9DIPT